MVVGYFAPKSQAAHVGFLCFLFMQVELQWYGKERLMEELGGVSGSNTPLLWILMVDFNVNLLVKK